MRSKYIITVFIASLLILISVGTAVLSYMSALNTIESQLKNSSMPLSIDNIYSEIHKNILEPNLVTSMMINDTFVHDWIKHGEKDIKKITNYLNKIKLKYNYLNTFFVSDVTKNYYTPKGILYQVKKNTPLDAWYFNFKKSAQDNEINLDTNEYIDKSLILFINNKMFVNQQFLGVSGVAIKISYITDMLTKFYQQYHFNVFFTDASGSVIIKNSSNTLEHLDQDVSYSKLKNKIFSKDDTVYEFTKNDKRYLVKSKYIDALQLYIIVEANVGDFIQDFSHSLTHDMMLSILFALIIIPIVLMTINRYQRRMEYLAHHDPLTGLANRRTFNERFEKHFLTAQKRHQPLTLLFIDIDHFKQINDTFGHKIGDDVLKELAKLFKNSLPNREQLARWGGEEFALLLLDTDVSQGFRVAEEMRLEVEECGVLQALAGRPVTVSIGLASMSSTDSIETLFLRADAALYQAKNQNRNQTVVGT